MNPFILGPDRTKIFHETLTRRHGRLPYQYDPVLPPASLALRLGRLLIRMGTKLAHEDGLQYISKDLVN